MLKNATDGDTCKLGQTEYEVIDGRLHEYKVMIKVSSANIVELYNRQAVIKAEISNHPRKLEELQAESAKIESLIKVFDKASNE